MSIEMKRFPHFPQESYRMELRERIGEENKKYNYHSNHDISIQGVDIRISKRGYQLLAHIQAPLEQ